MFKRLNLLTVVQAFFLHTIDYTGVDLSCSSRGIDSRKAFSLFNLSSSSRGSDAENTLSWVTAGSLAAPSPERKTH